MLVVPVPGIEGRARRARAAAIDRTTLASLPLVLFPLVVWLVATLWFGGELGRFSDDYRLLHRDPVSGVLELPAGPNPEHAYFWRPAFIYLINNLVTLAYGREWIVHVLSAVLHL